MAEKYKIGAAVVLDGEKEFKASVTSINSELKKLGSEMKKTTAQYSGNEKSIAALTAKSDILKKTLEAQKEKVASISAQLEKAKSAYQAAGEKVEKLKGKLADAKDALEKMTASGEASEDALQAQRDEIEKLEYQLGKAEQGYEKAGRSVNKWEADLNRAEAEVIENENEIKRLNEEIKKLGSEGAQSIAKYGEKLKAAGKAVSDVGKKLMPMTVALTGIGGASVKVATDFQAAMSKVKAISGATDKDFEKLSKAARDMGKATQFSATEAADALQYLALAGYTTQKSIDTLPTVLNLAAAGGIDLASASDMVTDAMSALGDTAGTAEEFVDKMAKTSQKSNTSVAQLGEAILTVGGTAKNLAGGTTELNTALGILADNGIKGAEGGTALRNIILSLTAPIDKAADTMEELGLKVFDARGEMRPLNEIFKDLDAQLSKMSQGKQIKVLNSIFNKVDLKSANALLANSGDRFKELSADIDAAQGSAQQMADTMTDNLNGSITKLQSALSEAGITIGNALIPVINKLVGFVQSLTDKFNALSPTAQTTIVVIGGIVAAIAPLLIVVGKVMSAIGTLMTFAPAITTAFGAVSAFVTGTMIPAITAFAASFGLPIVIIGGVVAALVLLYKKCEWFRNGVNAVIDWIKTALPEAGKSIGNFFTKTLPDTMSRAGESIGNFFTKTLPETISNAGKGIGDFFTKTLPETVSKAVDFVKSIADKLKAVVMSIYNGLDGGFKLAFENIGAIVSGFADIFKTQFEIIETVVRTVVDVIKAIFSGDFSSISDIIECHLDEIGLLFGIIFDDVVNIVVNAVALVINHFRGMFNTAVRIFTTLKDNVVNAFKAMFTNAVTLAVSFPGKVAAAFNQIVDNTVRIFTNLKDKVVNAFKSMITNAITLAVSFPAKVAAVFNQVVDKVKSWGPAIKSAAMTAIRLMIRGIIDLTVTLPAKFVTIGKQIIDGIKSGIKGAVNGLYQSIENSLKGLVGKAKKALGIHSPSKVFADEVGKNAALGIGVGFKNAMSGVSSTMRKAIPTDFDIPINAGFVTARAAAGANITMHNTFNSANARDGMAVVRLLDRELGGLT